MSALHKDFETVLYYLCFYTTIIRNKLLPVYMQTGNSLHVHVKLCYKYNTGRVV